MAVKGKVLIIEDDRAICTFMRRVLEANGFETVIVHTGKDGISIAASHCPDVVILDLGLPDIDGIEVIRRIRIRESSSAEQKKAVACSMRTELAVCLQHSFPATSHALTHSEKSHP